MAILWSKRSNNCLYEVRSAGATRRLYTNKVFHSQFNPNKVIQGGIWDLLYIPAFTCPIGSIQRILVLGVGGGTVLHQLKKFIQPEKIIGVELNQVHLYVAKNYFDLNDSGIKLIEADAINWLQNYKGEKFDMIIDDLFGHHDGEAERVITVNKQWADTLLKHLNPKGILVINFGTTNELKNCALIAYKKYLQKFNSAFRLTLSQYENAIGVFAKGKLEPKKLKDNFQMVTGLNTKAKNKKLNYRLKVFK